MDLSKAIYFDDGLMDTFVNARDIVKNYIYPKVICIVTGFVGKPIAWKNHKPANERSMGIYELKILISEGWLVASHSVTHRRMTDLSIKEVQEELDNSYKWIVDNLNINPCCFAFPYTESNECIFHMALKAYPTVRTQETSQSKYLFHSLSYNPLEKDRLIKLVNEHGE
jgi:peptidoglycan/xylan/chitin deacetylase (PgdA/CDA1 family)